jgi:hypothetical protein
MGGKILRKFAQNKKNLKFFFTYFCAAAKPPKYNHCFAFVMSWNNNEKLFTQGMKTG